MAHGHSLVLRRTPLTVIAVVGAIIGLAWGASRASAANACENGTAHLCLWQDAPGQGGPMWMYSAKDSWLYVGNAANDKVSYIENYRNQVSWLSAAQPHSSRQACIPRANDTNFTSVNMGGLLVWPDWSHAADTVSSYELSSTRTECPSGTQFPDLAGGDIGGGPP
jgi:hypothetical protein